MHSHWRQARTINLFSQVILSSKPMSTQSLAAMPAGYLQPSSYPFVNQGSQHLVSSRPPWLLGAVWIRPLLATPIYWQTFTPPAPRRQIGAKLSCSHRHSLGKPENWLPSKQTDSWKSTPIIRLGRCWLKSKQTPGANSFMEQFKASI